MNFLIYGAGTIGLTYAWLLSSQHNVEVLAKPDKIHEQKNNYSFVVHDLRVKPKQDLQFEYAPHVVTGINKKYDAILVTVNSYQLKNVLPLLKDCGSDIIFMQNNWDIQKEISAYLEPHQYLIGFPSQVGGGRENNCLEVNVYGEGTILSEIDGKITERLSELKRAFEQADLTVEIKTDILGWLKIHYLQQSISAGAILKAGGYFEFAKSYKAVKEMVYAFREGILVCQAYGVDTKNTFPAKMFKYPAPLVSFIMKSMFNQPNTATMVTGHMKHGMKEWITGFYEVLESGERKNISMSAWKSYKPFVDQYATTITR